MSQWGEERVFEMGAARIRVLPLIKNAYAFAPASAEDKIATIVELDFFGSREKCEELLGEIRHRYTGRPYSAWFQYPPSDDGHILYRSDSRST